MRSRAWSDVHSGLGARSRSAAYASEPCCLARAARAGGEGGSLISNAAHGPPHKREGAQPPPSWQADCDPYMGAGRNAEHAGHVSWHARSAGNAAPTALRGAAFLASCTAGRST